MLSLFSERGLLSGGEPSSSRQTSYRRLVNCLSSFVDIVLRDRGRFSQGPGNETEVVPVAFKGFF